MSFFFFFSSRRRHTRYWRDWSSDVCSSDLSKPVAIPGTYEKVAQKPQGFFQVISAPIEGVYQSIDIILFILIIGGCIGVLNNSGAFDAGIASLSRATKGREFLLIVIVTILISIGGTTYGMAEETIALYPILVPVFVAEIGRAHV